MKYWDSVAHASVEIKDVKGLKCLAYERLGNKCVRCGFSDIRALQIDHIRSNGAEERAAMGGHWTYKIARVYAKIINGCEDYQILCANCNWIKRAEKREYGPKPNKSKKQQKRMAYDLNGYPKFS
jgi:hypothetical protein